MASGLSGFKLKGKGVDAVLKSSGTVSLLRSRAGSVLTAAQSAAPVDSGAYRDSLHIEQTTAAALGISFRTGSNDRPAFIVTTDVPYAFAVEADHGVLARSIDAAGGS